jgi:iron complex outermembrane receptor protein
MRSTLLWLIVSVILLIANSITAGVYTGRVVDRFGRPIEGVNISTDIGALSTISDKEGNFVLRSDSLIPGYLSFTHVSFLPELVRIRTSSDMIDVKVIMQYAVYPGQNIRVTAMRAERGLTPVAFDDITGDDIKRDYTISDFPILLEMTPNMYSYSYTGGIAGASDYRIRGFDYKRIGVYINGIPLNDPEDRFTYFYDLPDFASEVADIQVQRGVGNSLYGEATFGGSINIASYGLDRPRQTSLSLGYGSFYADGKRVSDMRRQAVEYSSGLIDGRWSLAGRYSKIYSGGYRENAWYDGWAYSFSLSRLDEKAATTVNLYGGPIKAHLAFWGIDRQTEKVDRRANWSEYENEIDDFNQPHYELHNTYQINDDLTLKNTLYYIRGEGYYEQYTPSQFIGDYNIPKSDLVDTTRDTIDLIRQRWVTKDQYGWNPRLDWEHKNGMATLGGAFYYFTSEHWGEILWAENITRLLGTRPRYYEYFGKKIASSIYALEYYSLTEKIRLMGNLQLRYLHYDFDETRIGIRPGYEYDLHWLFLSPRAGITYAINDNSDIFLSFATASREPADFSIYDAEETGAFPQLKVDRINLSGIDTTYHFGDPFARPEKVYDFELGTTARSEGLRGGINLYWMELRDEIVAEGGIDDAGRPRVGNAKRSTHAGMEFDCAFKTLDYLTLSANMSYSYNRFRKHVIYIDYSYPPDGIVDDTLDYSGNPIPGFPDYIGNLIIDYDHHPYRLTYRLRTVGKQYVDNAKNEKQAIAAYTVSSLSASVRISRLGQTGTLTLSGRVDNLFNAKYELSGYSYWYAEYQMWSYEYYPAAERNFFIQLKWELE